MQYPIPEGYELVRVDVADDELIKMGGPETLWDVLKISHRLYQNPLPGFALNRSLPWSGIVAKMMKEGGPSLRDVELVAKRIPGSKVDPEQMNGVMISKYDEDDYIYISLNTFSRDKYEREEFAQEFESWLQRELWADDSLDDDEGWEDA